jgi:hypothetical protein
VEWPLSRYVSRRTLPVGGIRGKDVSDDSSFAIRRRFTQKAKFGSRISNRHREVAPTTGGVNDR